MKFISVEQSLKRQNSQICAVTEYPLGDSQLDFAMVNISGRYPDSGRVTNLKCKEIVHINEGSGKVVVNGQEQSLMTGDLVLIEPGEAFYWEGTMKLSISCHPAFTVEQHVVVD